MSSVVRNKLKQRLALARRIEESKRPAQPCSYCAKQTFPNCWLDSTQSSRCSECVRKKRACDTLGYAEVRPPTKPVCRFFMGPRREQPLPTPPPESHNAIPSPSSSGSEVFSEDLLPWFPNVGVDDFDFDLLGPEFWGDPGLLDVSVGMPSAAPGS